MAAICGWIADHTSDRSISFYTGFLVLAAATILFAVARSRMVLLVSRLLQGLLAAITYTVGLALLVDTVGRGNIGQWMGTSLSSSSFGLIVSPLLGGIVYAKAGYMAVFGMALGLICADIVMRLCMIEKRNAATYMFSESAPPANGFYGTFTNPESEHEDGQSNGHSNNIGTTPPTNPKPQADPEEAAPLLQQLTPETETPHPRHISPPLDPPSPHSHLRHLRQRLHPRRLRRRPPSTLASSSCVSPSPLSLGP